MAGRAGCIDNRPGRRSNTMVRYKRMWRNWQTRKVQVLVAHKAVEVRFLSSASTYEKGG